MKSIKIQNLSKEFLSLRGKITALQNINLDIEPGTFFVLLGPSGCGKTTLLNIIAGIENPTTGQVRIGERVAVSSGQRIFLTPKERNVAMVFQSYALYPHMNVFDNIAFPLKIAQVDKTEIRSRVDRVMNTLQIFELSRAKPSELSGGQRQRVAIGRAIVRKPNALLLDEPLSNLDAQLRVHMRGELKKLQRRLKITTLYVTHDQVEAMTLGDRIGVMKDARVQQLGSPNDIYSYPQNIFVARFVGSPPMNLLSGNVLSTAQKKLKVVDGLNKGEITIGVRPEHIRVKATAEQSVFRAQVGLVGSLGAETLLSLKIESNEILAKASSGTSIKEEDWVGVDFHEKDLHVFDKSGTRIQF